MAVENFRKPTTIAGLEKRLFPGCRADAWRVPFTTSCFHQSEFEYMSDSQIKPGVVSGEALDRLLRNANENNYAMPAVNVVGTNSINAVLEAAADVNSPVMIQFSNGGGTFFAGKSLSNDDQKAAVAGCVSGAQHVHAMAAHYGPRRSSHRSLRKETLALDRWSTGRR